MPKNLEPAQTKARVVVSGATGFIGQHLVQLLRSHGDSVRELSTRGYRDQETCQWTPLSGLTEISASISDFKPQNVFHLATRFPEGPELSHTFDLIETNVTYSTAVALGALESKARMINTATSWQMYGGQSSSVSIYSATKAAFSTITMFLSDVNDLELQQVFLFDTYGPNDNRRKIVSNLLAAAQNQNMITLGSRDKLINLTHVSDVIHQLHFLSTTSTIRRDWVIRQSSPTSLVDLVRIVEHVTGVRLRIQWDPERDRLREMRSDWVFGHSLSHMNNLDLQTGVRHTWNHRFAD